MSHTREEVAAAIDRVEGYLEAREKRQMADGDCIAGLRSRGQRAQLTVTDLNILLDALVEEPED